MPERVMLAGDVGGTNARFALVELGSAQPYRDMRALACVDFANPEDAIRAYLSDLGAPLPERICVAAAGPVVGGAVRFTNNAWSLEEDALRRSFGCHSVRLLNDFAAIAHGLPALTGPDLLPLGHEAPQLPPAAPFTFAVIGPGTGLGAAALLEAGGGARALVGEAGHAGFAPESSLQEAVLRELRHRFGRVSAERLVSGPGVENLYWALARIHHRECSTPDVASIFERAEDGSDELAVEVVELFHEILGQVAGDFTMAVGAWDGVFVAGGVAQRTPERLARSRFREGFENKGRHRSVLEGVPAALIVHPQPGLLGASQVVRQA